MQVKRVIQPALRNRENYRDPNRTIGRRLSGIASIRFAEASQPKIATTSSGVLACVSAGVAAFRGNDRPL
jgi:hypothetical protein